MRSRLPAFLALFVFLGACSSSGGPNTGTKVGTEPTATSPPASPAPSLTPTLTPSPTSTDSGVYQMGDVVETALGSKVTVYGWSTEVPTRQGNEFIKPSAGTRFSEVRLKMCPNYDPSSPLHGYDVAQYFSLVMRDNTVVPPDSAGYSGELQSNAAVIGPDQCVKGPLVFESPAGQKPKFVQFASSSVIQWRIP